MHIVIPSSSSSSHFLSMAAAADGLFRPIYEGCISGHDHGVERRPYHRNCGCALHSNNKSCRHRMPRCNNVSYPMRRAWSEGSLLVLSANSSAHSSPSTSPAPAPSSHRPQLDQEEEEEHTTTTKFVPLFEVSE